MQKEAVAAIKQHTLSYADDAGQCKENLSHRTTAHCNTIFSKCLASSHLTVNDKRVDRLAQEAFTIVVAGGEATARVLAVASFHIVANKHRVLSALRLELEAAFPDKYAQLDLKTLEKLPWLVRTHTCVAERRDVLLTMELQTAVIEESLRITTLVVSRLPLIAPCDALRYGQWSIPPGTPVSMSLRDILLDERMYERPQEFLPERWLARGKHSKLHLPFGRGSRMCIGMNLAMAELYVILGSMFRRFDLDLYQTTRERDIDVARDCFIGDPSRDSVGVRVSVSPVPQFCIQQESAAPI
jgi:cytochrome P450